jgi:hypothetical protein
MKTKIISVLALSVASISAAQATTITAWNFQNNALAVNNSPAASTGTGTATVMGMTNSYPTTATDSVATADVLVGVAADTGVNGVADTGNIWRIRGQDSATPTSLANGWSSQAPIGTQGAEFAASTAGYGSINVSFDWYSTNQGEAKLQLEYTDNGGATWINTPITVGSANASAGLQALTNSSSASTVSGSYIYASGGKGQNWFTGLTATITDPLAANNPNFAIALVNAATGVDDLSMKGTALNNSSGNWRFDNVVISGSAVSAVPVPAAVWLFGSALAGFLGLKRRKAA